MKPNAEMRKAIAHSLDALEMISWNGWFEAAIDAIDEMSNELHNKGEQLPAEILRWAAKELRGENEECN